MGKTFLTSFRKIKKKISREIEADPNITTSHQRGRESRKIAKKVSPNLCTPLRTCFFLSHEYPAPALIFPSIKAGPTASNTVFLLSFFVVIISASLLIFDLSYFNINIADYHSFLHLTCK